MPRNIAIAVVIAAASGVAMNFDRNILIIFLQDVFLMIRRHKTTIFTDAKENTSVIELKRMIEGKYSNISTYFSMFSIRVCECVCVGVCVRVSCV